MNGKKEERDGNGQKRHPSYMVGRGDQNPHRYTERNWLPYTISLSTSQDPTPNSPNHLQTVVKTRGQDVVLFSCDSIGVEKTDLRTYFLCTLCGLKLHDEFRFDRVGPKSGHLLFNYNIYRLYTFNKQYI